jgi:hypothetical protein
MSSEWMRVMLDEIARKKDEEAQARLELELRRREGDGRVSEPTSESGSPPPRGEPSE